MAGRSEREARRTVSPATVSPAKAFGSTHRSLQLGRRGALDGGRDMIVTKPRKARIGLCLSVLIALCHGNAFSERIGRTVHSVAYS
jgi:hypothetical protein